MCHCSKLGAQSQAAVRRMLHSLPSGCQTSAVSQRRCTSKLSVLCPDLLAPYLLLAPLCKKLHVWALTGCGSPMRTVAAQSTAAGSLAATESIQGAPTPYTCRYAPSAKTRVTTCVTIDSILSPSCETRCSLSAPWLFAKRGMQALPAQLGRAGRVSNEHTAHLDSYNSPGHNTPLPTDTAISLQNDIHHMRT